MKWHGQRGLNRLLSNQLQTRIVQFVPRLELARLSAAGVADDLRRAGEVDLADSMVAEIMAAQRRAVLNATTEQPLE
jgi:predicted nucleic acid-binding protein